MYPCTSFFHISHMEVMRKAIGYIMDANSLLGRMLCITVYILTYDFMFEHFVFKLFYYMGGVCQSGVVVNAGLSQGDKVIINGQNKVSEGVKVI